MPRAVCPVQRKLSAPRDPRVLGALPRRTESSGDREGDSISRPTAGGTGRANREGGTVGRAAELLHPSSRLPKLTRGRRASSVTSRSRRLVSRHAGLRFLTTLPNRNGVMCQSSIVPVALARLAKYRAPKSYENFEHTGSERRPLRDVGTPDLAGDRRSAQFGDDEQAGRDFVGGEM